MTAALSARNITVRFDGTVAVNDVSLEVPFGTSFGIVGESGSGKTTLMRVILGLQKPDDGEILIDGKSFGRRGAALRARAALIQPIFQDPAASLSPRCRIGTLMDEVATVLGEPKEETRRRLAAILRRIGVDRKVVDKYPHQISGGQARRVAIARALLMRPKILIADEPTAGLDISVQGDLLNLLQDLRTDDNVTLIVISHNLAAVRLIADSVIVMQNGAAVEGGPSETVFSRPQNTYTRDLIASWPDG